MDKTYCDKDGGCFICDRLFCDGHKKKEVQDEDGQPE